jgi:hypothetical protein
MKYTVYKITNNINGKIYVGCHQTTNLNDGYMGSGNLIRKAIKKYGVENFEKEYVHIFNSPEEMFDCEANIVNEDFVKRKDTYNIITGGDTGASSMGKISAIKRAKKMKSDISFRKNLSDKISKSMKQRWESGEFDGKDMGHRRGMKNSKEMNQKIGEANSKHQKGKGNSQYGTMWICNLELQKNKKIKKEDEIPEGWVKGKNKWKDIIRKQEIEKRKFEKDMERHKYYNDLYNDYKESGCKSFREFVRQHPKINHHNFIIGQFKKYVDGY